MAKEVADAKTDWSLFALSDDISHVTTEVLEKVKLLKNDAIFIGFVVKGLKAFREQVEASRTVLHGLCTKCDAFREAIEKEADEEKREVLLKGYKRVLMQHDKMLYKVRLENIICEKMIIKFRFNREWLLEEVRKVIDGLSFDLYMVNLMKVCATELLHIVNTGEEHPDCKRLVTIVQERFMVTIPNTMEFAQLDFFDPSTKDKFSNEYFENMGKTIAEGFAADEDQESSYFPLIFAYSLRQTRVQHLKGFLECHLEKYTEDFFEFLDHCLLDYGHLLQDKQIGVVRKWMEDRIGTPLDHISVRKPRLQARTKDRNFIKLSATGTAYLWRKLMQVGVFIDDKNIQSNGGHADALYLATGYSPKPARGHIGGALKNATRKDIKATQNILEQLKRLIDKDLQAKSN